jgi:hypothetical protein
MFFVRSPSLRPCSEIRLNRLLGRFAEENPFPRDGAAMGRERLCFVSLFRQFREFQVWSSSAMENNEPWSRPHRQ